MKYLEHHSIFIYKNGEYLYDHSTKNRSDLLLYIKYDYPQLSPYLEDVFYYGKDRFFIGDDEYVMIYNTAKVNSKFGS